MKVMYPLQTVTVDGDHRYVVASIMTDTKIPHSQFPETGENVDGLTAHHILLTGSTIMTPSFDIAIKGEEGWGDWNA